MTSSEESLEQIKKEVLKELARRLKIPLFLKNNLGWDEKIQEFPKSSH